MFFFIGVGDLHNTQMFKQQSKTYEHVFEFKWIQPAAHFHIQLGAHHPLFTAKILFNST